VRRGVGIGASTVLGAIVAIVGLASCANLDGLAGGGRDAGHDAARDAATGGSDAHDAETPDAGIDAADTPDAGDASENDCTTAGPARSACFDVSALFSQTDFTVVVGGNRTFGASVPLGQTAYVYLDGTSDKTYSLATSNCESSLQGMTRSSAAGYNIERQLVSANSYQLLVRGTSAPDCSRGSRALSSGTITVNPARGWKISQNVHCTASSDVFGRTTYCNVDPSTGVVSWMAGSTCGGCCACAGDGASVDIAVVVSRP